MNSPASPIPEIIPWPGHQSEGEFALKHEDGDSWQRTLRKQLEDEWGGDLVRCVGDADVEVREFLLYKIADNDLELLLLRPVEG